MPSFSAPRVGARGWGGSMVGGLLFLSISRYIDTDRLSQETHNEASLEEQLAVCRLDDPPPPPTWRR